MLRRALFPALVLSLGIATAAAPNSAVAKWPPWLSIESPVNPYDASARGAVCLVHARLRDGTPTVADLSGTAEGLVGGARRSVALRFDTTSFTGVFAVRRQWPSEGTWVLRISLMSTTAIVSLDHEGNVAGVRIPMTVASGTPVPRAVIARDIDSTLTVASAH
jgi:hypothetical protein